MTCLKKHFVLTAVLVCICCNSKEPAVTGEIPIPVSPKKKYTAAFLLSDGTLPLDYAGAYEVLGQAGMNVITLATTDTVRLSSNMLVVPHFLIERAPEFDILVVPVSTNDPSVIRWIKQKSDRVDYILTICGGVLPVYDAGLLDGKTITGYWPLIDHVKAHAKNANVVTDKRFIDNGKIITCGAYVSGIDGALYLVSKIYGEPRAREVANNIEYNWDKEYRFVRATLPIIGWRRYTIFGRL